MFVSLKADQSMDKRFSVEPVYEENEICVHGAQLFINLSKGEAVTLHAQLGAALQDLEQERERMEMKSQPDLFPGQGYGEASRA